ILHPEAPYGENLASAFRSAVEAEGGEVVGAFQYPAGATSFGQVVTELRGQSFDALYVADLPARVQLIAPALATGGLWASSAATRRGDRAVTLLLPSIAFQRSVLRQSGRYLEGAFFAVPFDPESTRPEVTEFVGAFQQRFGTTPDVYAASAFDALSLILSQVDGGRSSRREVGTGLAGTSQVTVGPSGGLSDQRLPEVGGRIFEVRDGALVGVLGS
ncbi:MAG: ABC transporter substrate-binding protein, partial [Myxococcota bacterium]